jgi:hypothetical protein
VCLHPTPAAATRPAPAPTGSAKALPAAQRQRLALAALTGAEPLTRLAAQAHVSRKFVYQQAAKAQGALDRAFAVPPAPSQRVLFHLPVTKSWLEQFTLGLVLIGHSPLRGVVELLRDLFDYRLSLGRAHAIVRRAVPRALAHNARPDLSRVRIGAHDEIFQATRPVLVGVDADSTYCYLLSPEEHRDADTRGVRLLELQERGFRPEATVADGGAGLRAGQKEALPGVPCRADVFHALAEVTPLARYLEGRAYEAIACRLKLERKQELHRWRTSWADKKVSQQLRYARPAEAKAVALADDVALLARWLRQDVLALAGPDHATRVELYDFVVAELRRREEQCPQRIRPVRTLLESQRDDLLAFARELDEGLAAVAGQFQVAPALAREVLQTQALPERSGRRWRREAALKNTLRARYYAMSRAVAALARRVVRASSVAENLNSRLRNYFFLRKQLGADYLGLLQFFLNHRRLARSARAERVGKSPAELLSGQEHAHWLELLGYRRFRRAG